MGVSGLFGDIVSAGALLLAAAGSAQAQPVANNPEISASVSQNKGVIGQASTPVFEILDADGYAVDIGDVIEGIAPFAKHLVIGDTDHTDSWYQNNTLFSEEMISKLRAAGVKTIGLELPDIFQDKIDELAAGEISKEEWVDYVSSRMVSASVQIIEGDGIDEILQRDRIQRSFIQLLENRAEGIVMATGMGMRVIALDNHASTEQFNVEEIRSGSYITDRLAVDNTIATNVIEHTDGKTAIIYGTLHDGIAAGLREDGGAFDIAIYFTKEYYMSSVIREKDKADIIATDIDGAFLTDTAPPELFTYLESAGFKLERVSNQFMPHSTPQISPVTIDNGSSTTPNPPSPR